LPARAPRRKGGGSRKRIPKSRERRGPRPDQSPLALDDPQIAEVVTRVGAAGGAVVGAYRDPLAGRALVLASLPVSAVQPTPFQRELSPTHTKRLAQRIQESGSFLDPLIAVADPSGRGFWTPNGRHRLAAAQSLGLESITVLISAEPDLAFRILALNTEKAHNLRDRSLEVIRMARALVTRNRSAKESDYGAEFESPALLTLGILYEQNGRFAGGAYLPLLRKVDRFDPMPTLAAALRQRTSWASRIQAIDERVTALTKELQKRGFRSPYLRAFVVARINPVRWVQAKKAEKKPLMPLGEALTRMAASVRQFDVASVKTTDLAMIAALSPAD